MRQLLLSILIFSSVLVYSQQKFDEFSISSSFGIHGGLRENGGAIMNMKFNMFSNDKIYSIVYKKIEEITLMSTNHPHEDYHEISTLIGGVDGYSRSRLEYQVGLSILWGVARGNRIYPESNYKMLPNFPFFSSEHFERDDFVTIGVPIHIGYKVFNNDIFSVGLDLDLNANLKSSYLSLGLCVEFGWMPSTTKIQEQSN